MEAIDWSLEKNRCHFRRHPLFFLMVLPNVIGLIGCAGRVRTLVQKK